MTFWSETITRLSVFKLVGSPGFHFRPITISRYSLGSTSVLSPERLRLSMSASKSWVNAACFSASSAEGLVHRTVVGAEHVEPVRRRVVTEDELAAGHADLARGVFEQLVEPCLGAPQRWRSHARRGRNGFADRLEHLADEAVGRPVRHADPAARFADAREFVRRVVLVRGEHHPEGRQHHVE